MEGHLLPGEQIGTVCRIGIVYAPHLQVGRHAAAFPSALEIRPARYGLSLPTIHIAKNCEPPP